MSTVKIATSKLTALANAVRTKSGESEELTLNDIPTIIPSLATPSIPSATWADGTWEEIEAMLDAHYDGRINIYDYWNVGDERTVALSKIDDNLLGAATANGAKYHPAQNATIVLVHKGGKTITSGNRNGKECAFICHHKKVLSSGYKDVFNSELRVKMNSSAKTTGWNGSDRRSWCNGNYYRGLPTALRNILKYVQNKTAAVGGASIQTTSDVCFLPAYSEITGSNYKNGSQITYPGEGTQWSYYANVANREKGNLPYWTRSPGITPNTPNYVYYHYTQGGEYSRSEDGSANYEYIIPAFCI